MRMESPKLTVLIFIDWYLPGYKAGGPIRSAANMVGALGTEIDFKIVCGDRDYLDNEPYANVDYGNFQKIGKADVRYLSPAEQRYGTVKQIMGDHPNARLYINGIFSRCFSIFPLRAAKVLGRKAIIAPRGMLAPAALHLKSTKKKFYLAFAKSLGWFSKPTFHATHTHEAGHIRNGFGEKANVSVIANIPSLPADEKRSNQKRKDQLNLLCVGRIAPEKNIRFALECLSEIEQRYSVKAVFIGPVYNQAYFGECKKVAAALPANINVEFSGAMEPYLISKKYLQADLFFLPTLGENYGHAIVEALLAGVPVLISDQTPWKNLRAIGAGLEIELSRKPAFVDYLNNMASLDEAAYQREFSLLPEKAAKLVDLGQIKNQYKNLFNEQG